MRQEIILWSKNIEMSLLACQDRRSETEHESRMRRGDLPTSTAGSLTPLPNLPKSFAEKRKALPFQSAASRCLSESVKSE